MAVLSAGQAANAQPRKHALLIGISDYYHFHPDDNPQLRPPFEDLNSRPDVMGIERALIHSFGFNPDPNAGEIVMITTWQQTTHDAIIAELQHLVDVTRPGDVVYIHYSGHGCQVIDPTEKTGYDSAIVPCDYKTPLPEDFTEAASNCISGRTFRHFIDEIRDRDHPSQIALSFDSCHSESMARGLSMPGLKRGQAPTDYLEWYEATHPDYKAPQDDSGTDLGPRFIVREQAAPAQDDLDGKGYVVISACRNAESAYETGDPPAMGRLSWCLERVLMQVSPSATYRDVFRRIDALFHAYFRDQQQHPQLDASNPDVAVLGGLATVSSPVVVGAMSPGRYTINAGSLQGLSIGSQFNICSVDAIRNKPATVIATAQVTAVGATSAILKLDPRARGVKPADLIGAKAVETGHDYSQPPLTFDASSLRRALPNQADLILNALAGLKMISEQLPPGVKRFDVEARCISRGNSAPVVALYQISSGSPIAVLASTDPNLPALVRDRLLALARYEYACSLGLAQDRLNPAYSIKARLVPTDAHGVPLPSAFPVGSTDQRLLIPLNSDFIVQVQNRSQTALHLAILDMSSRGDVDQVWPPPGTTAHDNVLLPTTGDNWTSLWVGSDTKTPAVYQATSEEPEEMFEFIGTYAATGSDDSTKDGYVDFGALAGRGIEEGPDSPFSDLFGPAIDGGERGSASIAPVDPKTWTATIVPFSIE